MKRNVLSQKDTIRLADYLRNNWGEVCNKGLTAAQIAADAGKALELDLNPSHVQLLAKNCGLTLPFTALKNGKGAALAARVKALEEKVEEFEDLLLSLLDNK